MTASVAHPGMQDIEAEVDALMHRAASQERMAQLVGCDQSQISRKATRVAAGDATWLEVLRASQLIALILGDERVGKAVSDVMSRRRLPMGDERDLSTQISREIERSAALTQTWVRCMADGALTREEINDLVVAADGLKDTCDAIIRDARAWKARRA
jgi:hypothetical protein